MTKSLESLLLSQIRIDEEMIDVTLARKQARALRRQLLTEESECSVCGFNIIEVLRMHHIIPVANGGTNNHRLLVWLCPTCHDLVHAVSRKLRRNKKMTDKENADRFLDFKQKLELLYPEDQVGSILYYADQVHKSCLSY